MESFNSQWIGDPSLENSVEPLHTSNTNLGSFNTYIDSGSSQFSGDSQDGLSELTLKPDKSEKNVVKFNLTNASLAKKRLQAYSKQVKIPFKEEKGECKEKRQDFSSRKKKDMYPTEKAKAVIEEIEEIKRKELEKDNRTAFKYLHANIDHRQSTDSVIKYLHANVDHRPSQDSEIKYLHANVDHRSSQDSGEQFRRRDIKQRNYRRTDSTSRKSASPEDHRRRGKTRSSSVHKYPKDWSEYDARKHEDKSYFKTYSKNRSVNNLLENLYNFYLPSPSIELFRCGTENGVKEISPFFLKRTKSQPSVVYSVNFENIKESFLTRDQLYQLVSDERRETIKNVITTHSKSQPFNKKIESKLWYNKTWRKQSDAECKVLEKSVGLSFLQNYSDEEEENETEEIVICSSINNANKSNIEKSTKKPEKKIDELIIATESQTLFQESNSNSMLNASEVLEDESGILTPEIPLQLQKSFKRTEETSIVELNSKKEFVQENISSEQKSKDQSKKTKLPKKKTDDLPKKKKKKKKRSRHTSDDESDSTDVEKKKKKKRKKSKNKKESGSNSKDTGKKSKAFKSKKKAKIAEHLELKDKYAKKNKKERANIETKSPILDDLRKKLKQKQKKKKLDELEDAEELRKHNKQYSDKSVEEQKTIDLIEINKNYRRSLEFDIQHTKKDDSRKLESDLSKTPKKSVKEEFDDDFPLQKKNKSNTPDTDEYKGNWEKDSFESEGDNTRNKTMLNSSWESDDDLYERQERPNEHSRNYSEVSNLEMPLNIKPFKKRDLDIDIEALRTKNEETKLRIENIIPMNSPVVQIFLNNKIKSDTIGDFCINLPVNIEQTIPEKKRRWDKTEKESTPIRTAANPSLSSLSLENEYVEFLKAVTSNSDQIKGVKIDDSVISVSSNESVEIIGNIPTEKVQESESSERREKTECIISPKDIPFIPMPDEVKPVPVPSPKLENPPKALISFNISTSVIKRIHSPIESHNLKTPLEEISIVPDDQELNVDSSTVVDYIGSPSSISSKDVKADEPKSDEKKPFTFTTLILPTKKQLLDNSNLKLGDSDDETDNTMKPIEEIRKEHLIDAENVKEIVQTEENLEYKETTVDLPKLEVPKLEVPVQKEKSRRKSPSPPPKNVHIQSVKSEKKDVSPKRNRKRENSPRRKGYSPKRESSPKRRRRSPGRFRDRRRKSSGGRRYSSRRSSSPRRRSPRRSLSPRGRLSSKAFSKDTDRYISSSKLPKLETSSSTAETTHRQKSPTIASPLEGLKRSVADSTISDDSLLPQPNLEEYTQSPVPHFFNSSKSEESKRISLDDRINLELGWQKEDLQPMSTTYESYNYNHNQFVQNSQSFRSNSDNRNSYSNANLSSNFVQVGNMVQIVPKDMTEFDSMTEFVQHGNKSQILQVGNMLQIVPTELPPEIPLPPTPSTPLKGDSPNVELSPVRDESAELEMKQKVSERRAERDKRKKERELRRKEKENRRREKEKQRNVKMKQKTENMIMRALQLEVENNETAEDELNESATHWPPSLNVSSCKDVLNKSILVQGRRRNSNSKSVQFADGVRPGEGTSPSAGEDLCSPPPSKVLPKEKRYTKTKLRVRNIKKKVKVKVIKHNPEQPQSEEGEENDDDDDDDYLPPPSPPPGSPPSHLFPPRIKTIVNNIHAYVPNVLGGQNPSVYSSVSVNPMITAQTLSHLQQIHIAGAQPPPPLPEPHIQVHHHLAHYQLSSSAPPPPPMGSSDSPFGSSQRNPHLYKYTTH